MNRRSFLRTLISAPVAAVVPAAAMALPAISGAGPAWRHGGITHGEMMQILGRSETVLPKADADRSIALMERINAASEQAGIDAIKRYDVARVVTKSFKAKS